MFSERSLRGPIWWEAGARGKQISSRPISSLIWPYRGNNEPLRCCLSPTRDLSPPPTNLHSQTVCFAFTYTYNLKESFRSWIRSAPPPPPSLQDFYWSFPHQWCRMMSFLWTQTRKKKSFILELEVAQSFICNAVLVVQPLWSKQPLGSHVVYIIIIDFRRRDYTSALDMVMFSSTSARQLMSDKATPPSPRGRQQRVTAGNYQTLWISVTFQSNLPASCKRFLLCLVPPSSSEQSGHICVRQSSTGDFRHQKMDGNVSALNKYTQQLPSVPPSSQQMLQLGRVFSPMVQCGSTFVYLSTHSRTCLEWMRILDVARSGARAYVCVGGGPRWRRLPKPPSCTRWGCVTPL